MTTTAFSTATHDGLLNISFSSPWPRSLHDLALEFPALFEEKETPTLPPSNEWRPWVPDSRWS